MALDERSNQSRQITFLVKDKKSLEKQNLKLRQEVCELSNKISLIKNVVNGALEELE